MEYRQDRISESPSHTHINPDEKNFDGRSDADEVQTVGDIKYWSDFGRVYYLPRTVQTLPDPGEWESLDGDWNLGQAQFFRYNEVRNRFFFRAVRSDLALRKDTSLMDGSFRLFLEECDLLQVYFAVSPVTMAR